MGQSQENGIKPFVDRRGKLVESFEGFSDDQLRLCLAQLIDGLERMDELADGVDFVEKGWRGGGLDVQGWKREVDRKLRTTPMVQPTGESPWMNFQWENSAGKDCLIQDMSRQDLEMGISHAWEHSRRFARMFNAASREANRLMAGEHLQAEWDKPEIQEAVAPPRRRMGGR